jgi:hypothetical protein
MAAISPSTRRRRDRRARADCGFDAFKKEDFIGNVADIKGGD